LHNKSQNVLINNHEVSPLAIVTALVDRIEVNHEINIDINRNIKLGGFTSWVGKSSCEVTMKVEQELSNDDWQKVLEARFLVCARNISNTGPA
jgi:acyl-CoA hydrolase